MLFPLNPRTWYRMLKEINKKYTSRAYGLFTNMYMSVFCCIRIVQSVGLTFFHYRIDM